MKEIRDREYTNQSSLHFHQVITLCFCSLFLLAPNQCLEMPSAAGLWTGCVHRRAASSSNWLLCETKCEVICCDQNPGQTGNSLQLQRGEGVERNRERVVEGSGWGDESWESFLLLLCISFRFVLPRFYTRPSAQMPWSLLFQFCLITRISSPSAERGVKAKAVHGGPDVLYYSWIKKYSVA